MSHIYTLLYFENDTHMVDVHHYYNIFSPEGKLLQVEYALEAVSNSNPIVITRNKNIIVCAAKKLYTSKLMDEEPKSIFRVSSKVYALITGIAGDVDQVVLYSKSLGSNKEAQFGIEITPDILCRTFADKIQELIQATGQRAFAFGAAFFGFDFDGPSIYATDTSSTHYPYYGHAFGEKAGRVRSFLEENLNEGVKDEELIEITIQALLESVGEDTQSDGIDVALLMPTGDLKYLDHLEKDCVLQKIADK